MQTNSNQHTADVILRSSDAKMFYSWKTLLSIASSVFNDMFTLPQPEASNNDNVDGGPCQHDGLPVIDLTEDGCTLGCILSLCHPPSCTGEPFKPVNSVRELRDVLEATMKYDMEKLRCVVLKELTNPSFLREDPLRVYVLACQHQCRNAARLAAKRTLALPTLVREYVPELEKIHAGKLWRLLSYREACMAAVHSLADNHTWIVYTRFSPLFGCKDDADVEWTTVSNPPSRKYPSGRTEHISVHTWWLEYMRKSGNALQRSPHGDSVKDKKFMNGVLSAISSSECKQCNPLQVWETFQSFVDSFAEHIERRVAEVRFVSPVC